MNSTDLLVFSAHPDDAELACAGSIAAAVASGKKVVMVDLTEGEMGTRGTVAQRRQEAAASTQILGISDRINLELPDCGLVNSREHQLKLIEAIRAYKPKVVLCNAFSDRHPDHGMAAILEKDACFLSGLAKIETYKQGVKQEVWKPERVYHYIQDQWFKPDFVVDISEFWNIKVQSIQAFSSQFYKPESVEPSTYISSPTFLDFVRSRAREMGHFIGAEYGEGFQAAQPPGVKNILDLL